MARAIHLERARSAQSAQVALTQLPFVAGVLKRLVWISGAAFVTAITAGPLFAPATASGPDRNQLIRVSIERNTVSPETADPMGALKCRSHDDGRQERLLELAQAQLGGGAIDHVATRFWTADTGKTEVTFEIWHGASNEQRKLYVGRGTVDMDSCRVDLISLV